MGDHLWQYFPGHSAWPVSEWVEFNAPLDTIQVISEAETNHLWVCAVSTGNGFCTCHRWVRNDEFCVAFGSVTRTAGWGMASPPRRTSRSMRKSSYFSLMTGHRSLTKIWSSSKWCKKTDGRIVDCSLLTPDVVYVWSVEWPFIFYMMKSRNQQPVVPVVAWTASQR